jgi:hypothetical protein
MDPSMFDSTRCQTEITTGKNIGKQCQHYPLARQRKCRDHIGQEGKALICEHPTCNKQKLPELRHCRDHAPKNSEGKLIGRAPMKLACLEDVVEAMASTANLLYQGEISAAECAAQSTLLYRLHDAYSEKEKKDPKAQLEKAVTNETAHQIAAKMTKAEAILVAQGRAPHLVANLINRFAEDKEAEELTQDKIDALLGGDV